MRYFHRTSLPIDDVLAEADRYFGQRMQSSGQDRSRTFTGAIGEVTLSVKAEGGHYTLITLTTDDVGESEIDKLAKRFLGIVHRKVHEEHVVRGAY
ncbi:MAG: hypothetical protein V3T28_01865 [Gemmatimonadales bacterium]